MWTLSWRADPRARPLADRHYNRQKQGALQFVPPGRCVVLLTPEADALWITSWPKYVQHAWPGAWNNTLFRNENHANLSSSLIIEAVAATLAIFGTPPADGMITMVAPESVRSNNPGFCYLKAGFRKIGYTVKRKRLVLQLLPEDMPAPAPPL
jgi:hypothetical protein